MGKGLWVVLLLVAVAALSWWLQRSSMPDDQRTVESVLHEPDYYMTQFEATALNLNGKPAHKLYADKMQHYPDDDSATLDKPHLMLFRSEEEFWDIRAETGLVSNGGASLFLQGEVIIMRVNATHSPPLQLYTSDLTVRPDDKTVETAAPVTIKDGRGVTTAVGMWADLNQRQVKLLSNVRGIYEPQSD